MAEAYQGAVGRLVNTSSLGEMEQRSSAYYLSVIQKLNPRNAILLNRLLNTYDPNTEPERERENGWYFQLDDHWISQEWELAPDFTRIPYTEMFHNRELLWMAERASSPQDAITCDYAKQVWYAGFTTKGNVRHANQLVFQTGWGSMLCELFEVVGFTRRTLWRWTP